jgi:hypothetical protein
METVKLELDMEEILQKPVNEQIKDLVRIAFMNHSELKRQGTVIYGNGKEGLCESVRKQGRSLVFLSSAFCTAAGTYGGILYSHLVK